MTAPSFSDRALAYLTEHAIRPEVAHAAGVREAAGALTLPCLDAEGLPTVRRRTLNGSGPKVMGEAGRSLGLTWWHQPPETVERVIVCEGEADALAALSAARDSGSAARMLARAAIVSVPSTGFPPDRLVRALSAAGARAAALAYDSDDAGRKAGERARVALVEAGITAFPVRLPEGADVADLLARVQPSDRAEALANALLNSECSPPPPAEVVDPADEARDGQSERRDVFRLLTGEDLLALPDPSWLLDGLLPSAGLSVLYGASGTGKSFVALDWALSVAAGVAWHGREVEPRWVVYVAAEGTAGLGARYRAWLESRGLPGVERVRFLTDAVNLLDKYQVSRARRTLAALPQRPGLLVVDTMARTMVGGDENAAKDVGEFVHAVDALRGGGAALVVHHAGHEGERERGSSALGAAADARLQLVRDGRTPRLTLTNPRQKDAPESAPLDLHLDPCGGSLVVSPVPPEPAREAQATAEDIEARVLAVVEAEGPASKRAVRNGVRHGGAEVGNDAIDKALERLLTASRITATGKGTGAGYEACRDTLGTLRHGAERSPGGSVPEPGGRAVGPPGGRHAPRPGPASVPGDVPDSEVAS